MSNDLTKKLFILGCSISMLHLILIWISSTYNMQHFLKADSQSYLSAAEMLMNGKLHPTRSIGYPAFLLMLKIIPTTSLGFYVSVHATQFLLWLACLWLVLKFTPSQKKWIWAILFTLLIINPSFVMFSNLLLSEILFLFLVLLGFYFLREFFQSKRASFIIAFILCILAAIWVRPGLFYFGVLSIIVSLFFLLRNKRFVSAALIIGSTMVMLAWPMRIMKNTYGNYTISYIDKITQYRYLNTQCQSIDRHEPLEEKMKTRDALSKPMFDKLSELSRAANDETLFFITSKPKIFLRAFFKNLYLNFHAGNEYLSKDHQLLGKHYYGLSRILNIFFVLLLLVCLSLFVIRFFSTKNKGKLLFSGILLFYCFYSWFTSGISFYQGDRFNIVWLPILVIFMFQFFKNEKYVSSQID